MPTMTEERLLTVEEFAERLRVSAETVRRYLRAGRIKGHQPASSRFGWRIPESEVQRFLRGEQPPE